MFTSYLLSLTQHLSYSTAFAPTISQSCIGKEMSNSHCNYTIYIKSLTLQGENHKNRQNGSRVLTNLLIDLFTLGPACKYVLVSPKQ